MCRDAKRRATHLGVPFNIVPTDIVIPRRCPVLGLLLKKGQGRAGFCSPSLDRLVPSKGYVKGNVIVVSHRANTLRSDATVDELRRLYEYYRRAVDER